MKNHYKEKESGIYVGNQLDKSDLRNPISRRLVEGFDKALYRALDEIQPTEIHEVGCGEGRLANVLAERYKSRILASDFSEIVINENLQFKHPLIDYLQLSIYELDSDAHSRDTIICCEVLEHLEDPVRGLEKLYELNANNYVFSVPREPVWRILNMCRLKYIPELGNTPGHLNHWNYKNFLCILEKVGFKLVRAHNPFPWIMVSLKK